MPPEPDADPSDRSQTPPRVGIDHVTVVPVDPEPPRPEPRASR